MTHNIAAIAVASAAPTAQLNLPTEQKNVVIAAPLIELSHSNNELPLAFGFSIPADNDDCYDKKSDYNTSKQLAKSSTMEWHDRGKCAALKAEARDVSQDKCHDDWANKKLSLLAGTKIRCRNKTYAAGSKVNNIGSTSETLSLSSSTEIATKDKDNFISMQPTKCKTVAVAGPLIKLTDSNRDQTAKLPLAFAFSISMNDTGIDRKKCYTSKQTAIAATKEWYDRGKLAALDVEVRDVAQYEWDGWNNHDMESHVDADEIVDSCTLENRVKYTNNCDGSTTVNNNSCSETPSLPFIEIGNEQEESIATKETNNKSSGILDVEKHHDATIMNIDKSILRFQRSAILALHEGVEAYLVSLFPGSKRTSGNTQGSRNPKNRKYQPGKENRQGTHELPSSQSCYRPRPVAMLVETSDCPPGLPDGWTSETYRRASGKSAGDTDTYWYTPQQKLKFRSKSNITRFLEILNTPDINGDEIAAWNVFKKRHGY